MEESIDVLEKSPDALPSDKILCRHVKMIYIGERVSVEFSMDDPSAEVSISEPKVNYALKDFEKELRGLQEQADDDDDRKSSLPQSPFPLSGISLLCGV